MSSSLKEHILTSQVFNIYVIRRFPDSRVQLVYEMCAYCAQGKHKLKFYKGWQKGRGFLSPFRFSSSFKQSFFGAKIRIGTIMWPPMMFQISISSNGLPVYAGQEYWLLETLAKSLDFSIKIVTPRKNKGCFRDIDATKLGGYCEGLYKREVDLAGFPADITIKNYQFLDPTGNYHMVQNRLISVKPVVKKEITFTVNKAFHLLLIVLCIGFAFLTVVADRIHGGNNLNEYIRSTFQIISVLFLEGVRCINLRLINMIILGFWLIGCFLLICNYFGEMTSTATVDKPLTNYINSLEDMKEQNYSWIVTPNFEMDLYLGQKLPEQARFKLTMPLEAGLKFLMENGSRHVFVFPKEGANAGIRFKFWDGKGKNPFHFSPPVLGYSPLPITVLVRKDSPYTREITKSILQMDASGLIKHKFIPDTIDLMGKLGKPKSQRRDERKLEKVGLPSLSLYLYVCLFMLCVATLVFIVEVCSLPFLRYIMRIMNERHREGRVAEGIAPTPTVPAAEGIAPTPIGPVVQTKELPPVEN